MTDGATKKKHGTNDYAASKAARRQLRREHRLGFHRPPKRNRAKGNSIVSIPIDELTDAEFELLQKKISVLGVGIEHNWIWSIRDLVGNELAYALIEAAPDMEKIQSLVTPSDYRKQRDDHE